MKSIPPETIKKRLNHIWESSKKPNALEAIIRDYPKVFIEDLRERIKNKEITAYKISSFLKPLIDAMPSNSVIEQINPITRDLILFELFSMYDNGAFIDEIIKNMPISSAENMKKLENKNEIEIYLLQLKNENNQLEKNKQSASFELEKIDEDDFWSGKKNKRKETLNQQIDDHDKRINLYNKSLSFREENDKQEIPENDDSIIEKQNEQIKELISLRIKRKKIWFLEQMTFPEEFSKKQKEEIENFYDDLSKIEFSKKNGEEDFFQNNIDKTKIEIDEVVDLNKFRINSTKTANNDLYKNKICCNKENIHLQIKWAIKTAYLKYKSWYDYRHAKDSLFSVNVNHGEDGQKRASDLYRTTIYKEKEEIDDIYKILQDHFLGKEYNIRLFRGIGNRAHSFDTYLIIEFAHYGILHYFMKDENNDLPDTRDALAMKMTQDPQYRRKIKESLSSCIDSLVKVQECTL